MKIIEILYAVLMGIVEGITEWLPISSTGHMILLDRLFTMDFSKNFTEMFQVVIQLGAILAVVVVFFHRLNPFAPSKSSAEKKRTWVLWSKVVVGMIPAMVAGVLLKKLYGSIPDTFFMAIPVMAGASLIEVLGFIKDGIVPSSAEWCVLIIGIIVAFAVSLAVIRFLMDFVKKHSFESFGWYRIVLGIVVIIYFAINAA